MATANNLSSTETSTKTRQRISSLNCDAQTLLRLIAAEEHSSKNKLGDELAERAPARSEAGYKREGQELHVSSGSRDQSIWDFFQACERRSPGLVQNDNYRRRFLDSLKFMQSPTFDTDGDEDDSIFDFLENENADRLDSAIVDDSYVDNSCFWDDDSVSEFFRSAYVRKSSAADKHETPEGAQTASRNTCTYIPRKSTTFIPPPPPPRKCNERLKKNGNHRIPPPPPPLPRELSAKPRKNIRSSA